MAAALVIDNLIDLETTLLSASNFIASAPPEYLREEHVGRKWRDNSVATWVLADLASSQSIDTIALLGVSDLGSSSSFQVRLSSVDATGAAGDVLDTGALSGMQYFNGDYQTFGYLGTSSLSARYVRIDIAQPSATYIEAGRWIIGLRQEFEINMQTPWNRVAGRASANTVGIGGQTFVDRRTGHWAISASFEFLSEAEREEMIDLLGIAIVNTGHRDILWINDTASTQYPRDFIWGYVDGDLRLTQNLYIIPPLYGVELPIRQRL